MLICYLNTFLLYIVPGAPILNQWNEERLHSEILPSHSCHITVLLHITLDFAVKPPLNYSLATGIIVYLWNYVEWDV